MSSRRKRGGPSALACLGKTKKGRAPREDKKGSVPREDIPKRHPERSEGFPHGGASLTLGRTKKDAQQDGVGDFFEIARGLKFGLAIIFFA
jgi:hypothetical protein